MPRGRAKKGQFDDLDSDFKDTIAAMSDDDIRKKISEVAVAEHENKQAKKADMDLEEKKMAYSQAGEQYKEASKANKLRITYAYDMLAARGKV